MATNRCQLEIEHVGTRVVVTVGCQDIYAAIQLYEELCKTAKDGYVTLDVTTLPRAEHVT